MAKFGYTLLTDAKTIEDEIKKRFCMHFEMKYENQVKHLIQLVDKSVNRNENEVEIKLTDFSFPYDSDEERQNFFNGLITYMQALDFKVEEDFFYNKIHRTIRASYMSSNLNLDILNALKMPAPEANKWGINFSYDDDGLISEETSAQIKSVFRRRLVNKEDCDNPPSDIAALANSYIHEYTEVVEDLERDWGLSPRRP